MICLFFKVLRKMHGHFIWLTEDKRPCTYTISHLKQARFLLFLFCLVTVLHCLEIYLQSVFLKLVFLKKLSFKNVRHNEKWKSQKRWLFTAPPLGFPHVSGSPCWLSLGGNNIHGILSRNPLWSGSQWSPNKQSQSSPEDNEHLFRKIPHHPPKQLQKEVLLSKHKGKKKAPLEKIIKEHFIFILWGLSRWRAWKQRTANEGRGFGWIWWRPSEGGSEWALRFWWSEDQQAQINIEEKQMAQNLRRLKPEMTFKGDKIHFWLKEIIKEEKNPFPCLQMGQLKSREK